jgi:hypothetical protein
MLGIFFFGKLFFSEESEKLKGRDEMNLIVGERNAKDS